MIPCLFSLRSTCSNTRCVLTVDWGLRRCVGFILAPVSIVCTFNLPTFIRRLSAALLRSPVFVFRLLFHGPCAQPCWLCWLQASPRSRAGAWIVRGEAARRHRLFKPAPSDEPGGGKCCRVLRSVPEACDPEPVLCVLVHPRTRRCAT